MKPLLVVPVTALGMTMTLVGQRAQSPVFTSRIEIVRLDVLATQDGHPVPGLAPDDFEVRDNGVRQDVTLVSVEELPLDVTLTVDLSSSVTGNRLRDLRAAGQALLGGLRPNDRAGLVAFNQAVSRLRPLTTASDDVRRALDGAEPSGGTALIDAAFASIVAAEPATDRRNLVVLFSDGVDVEIFPLRSFP